MKKFIVSIVFLLAIAAGVSSYAYYRSHVIAAKNALAQANVEALTEDEFPNANTQDYLKGSYWCCGPGSGVCSAHVNCSSL